MPRSSFNNPDPGDIILDTDVDQFIAPLTKVETGLAFWALDTASGTDNYTVTLDPAVITSYDTGLFINFTPNTSNTGTATVNLNGIGSNIIKKGDGTLDLEDGDLLAGNIYKLVYNGSNFVLLSSASNQKLTTRAVNGEAFTIKKGQPVKLFSGGAFPSVKLARADSTANYAFGVAATQVATGDPFDVIRIGVVSQSDWTDVIGSATLTFNQEYFLAQGTAGILDPSPPTGVGNIIQSLGVAISTTKLYIFCRDYHIL